MFTSRLCHSPYQTQRREDIRKGTRHVSEDWGRHFVSMSLLQTWRYPATYAMVFIIEDKSRRLGQCLLHRDIGFILPHKVIWWRWCKDFTVHTDGATPNAHLGTPEY